ncbi:AraC family transcriptional regulator [Humidesulfovibrio mexicanus]|uniref:AraC family transcriptional regulator n=1 Tax=Humidesulfovibrio mexicanus TaxID=147047 RepID=A0A238ZHI8_9BACT|nr:AraC family transcriptional regulator [Humidesulfovibrio mexicanus]SNR82680.1 AraC family transcriptional regulator [Humidesulfovibrio mexicanus]
MKADTKNLYAARMLKVLNHMQRRLDDPIRLDELAALAHFSTPHFHRVFKGMIGETVMDHLRRIRLERAYVRLAQTTVPVTEAAFEAGYDSLEAFSRVFRKTFGLSPTECRAQGWTRLFPEAPSGVHYCAGEIREFILNDSGAAVMNMRIETLPDIRIAKVRQTGPYMESAERAWKILCGWGAPKGLVNPKTLIIGISYDDPSATAPEELRYDAAISIDNDLAVEEPVSLDVLPGGEYAVFTHQGPYQGLEETYKTIMSGWIPTCDREFRDSPWFEIYRNDPATTPPAQLITDIHIPLK